MIIEALAAGAGLWGVRTLAHRAILHGLRAPRLPHPHVPDGARAQVCGDFQQAAFYRPGAPDCGWPAPGTGRDR